MAIQTLEVVVENGVFRPVNGPMPFSEGQHVIVVAEEVESEAQKPRKPFVFGLHKGLVGWDPTFDDELPDSFWLGEE